MTAVTPAAGDLREALARFLCDAEGVPQEALRSFNFDMLEFGETRPAWEFFRPRADALLAGPLATLITKAAECDAAVAELADERESHRIADIMGEVGFRRMVEAGDERDGLKASFAAAQARVAEVERERDEARERADRLDEALTRIVQWADAYPETVFTPPNYSAIRDVLHANGFVPGQTLDGIAADCMRQAVNGVGSIARTALSRTETSTESTGGESQATSNGDR